MSLTRVCTCLLVVVGVFIIATSAFAQKPMWYTYHGDVHRSGQNPDSAMDPAGIRLIWVFPRSGNTNLTEDDTAIDDTNADNFSATGWQYSQPSTFFANNQYFSSFRYAGAIPPKNPDKPDLPGDVEVSATWTFPMTNNGLPAGKYTVFVWVPTDFETDVGKNVNEYQVTTAAQYTVRDSKGTHSFVLNQTDGGNWQQLSDMSFTFNSDTDYVSVSNRTADYYHCTDPNASKCVEASQQTRKVVLADALRFVPDTGQAIYSSPASAQIDVDWALDKGPRFTGKLPVAYLGTAEPPYGSVTNAKEMGSVYCVNSITTNTARSASTAAQIEMADLTGTDLWRWPRKASLGTNPRDPLEGPIEGGVYASPTVSWISDDSLPGKKRMVVFVAGMDRQVYCFDAQGDSGTEVYDKTAKTVTRSPVLLWKGPGLTKTEETATITGTWAEVDNRDDAFGGKFRYIACAPRGTDFVVWEFPDADRKNAGEPAGVGEGWVYTVYVWMPAMQAGDPVRNKNASYKITYIKAGGVVDTDTVTLDMTSADRQGRWVSLNSYYNVQSVTLLNDSTDVGVVVADACMIVPRAVQEFSYSTPVSDVENISTPPVDLAGSLFACTAGGRVLSFEAKSGKVQWIYPAIQSKLVVTGSEDPGAEQPALGAIVASPAYQTTLGNGRLIIADMDGQVRCLENVKGTGPPSDETGSGWVFPNAQDKESYTDVDGTTVKERQIETGGFSSSPCIDPLTDSAYIGSVDGGFYALNLTKQVDLGGNVIKQHRWAYPGKDGLPKGAFRFSTPAVATLETETDRRVWAGSTDMSVYCFNTKDGTELTSSTTPAYSAPSLGAAVQSSVTIDKTGDKWLTNMFVGGMNNVLNWRRAKDGSTLEYAGYRTDGELFSSPNLTTLSPTEVAGVTSTVDYLYIGGSDGRMYAFSDTAWGGEFSQEFWPFSGSRDQSAQLEKVTDPTLADPQIDLFSKQFYDDSNTFNANSARDVAFYYEWPVDVVAATSSNWIVSKEMKLPTVTWSADPTKRDDDINKALRVAAKERRNKVYPDKTKRVADDPIYFEWGETIRVIIWNLPPLNEIYGSKGNTSAKRSSIKVVINNASSGASAGTLMPATVNSIKEYVVLDSTKKRAGAPEGYQALLRDLTLKADDPDNEVRRSYALATVKISPASSKPPSPGPGWELSCEITGQKEVTPGVYQSTGVKTIKLAKLEAGSAAESVNAPVPKTEPGGDPASVPPPTRRAVPQQIGINNPLAIKDDGSGTGSHEVGWPSNLKAPDRTDPEAHFNGNAAVANGRFSRGSAPTVSLGPTIHGTWSLERALGVIDRSAVKLMGQQIDRFRISGGELSWRGGEAAIKAPDIDGNTYGVKLPWEMGIGSPDYPSISSEAQNYLNDFDELDPREAHSTLPPLFPTVLPGDPNYDYEHGILQPTTVVISAQVPRFQPANMNGFGLRNTAYVDSNKDGKFDSGNVIEGRPSVYQEAYRTFRLDIQVPPDPRIEVEESQIDLGSAAHGLGLYTSGAMEFNAFNPNPEVQEWFRPITIKNSGNVNLYNVHLDRRVGLMPDPSTPSVPIPGGYILSSMDSVAKTSPLSLLSGPPFTTAGLGYTLSKPRVGEVDPTVMSIPDHRKWDRNYDSAQDGARQFLNSTNPSGVPWFNTDLDVEPLPPMVGLQVPLAQSIGTYSAPYVPVFSDTNANGVWDAGEPISEPSFKLKIKVEETQVSGGVSTSAALAQVDTTPRIGDSNPVAFRDVSTGDVHLWWSSNRLFDAALYPDFADPTDPRIRLFASAPWFINYATLDWDTAANGWTANPPAVPTKWWNTPVSRLPDYQWVHDSSFAKLMKWPDNASTIYSVRHTSPTLTENLDVPAGAASGRTWMAWVGAADLKNPDNTITQQQRIYYADVSHGKFPASPEEPYLLDVDSKTTKRNPNIMSYENWMWIFWQSNNSGRLGISYAASNDPTNSGSWGDETQLRTPDTLVSLSSVNALDRYVWKNQAGGYNNPQHLIDVIYAGTDKVRRSSDIYLTRYAAVAPGQGGAQTHGPGRRSQPMPRVYNEPLERDSKYGFYTSQHIAWVRLDVNAVASGRISPPLDAWGAYDPTAAIPDMPYIHVVLGDGYPYPIGTVVSGTDGSIVKPDGTVVVPPSAILPEVDSASGLYSYRYQSAETRSVLGAMLVDFSAGVVRFTEPLKERLGSKTFVLADYTPQSWRLTTGSGVNSSPRAFIERTAMSADANPGVRLVTDQTGVALAAPVDRLWVFWKKSDSPSIFYKNYRIGVDLTRLMPFRINADNTREPLKIKMNPNGTPVDVRLSGNLGGFEVSRTGTRIYFTEADERYNSLEKIGSTAVWGTLPGAITVNYTDIDGNQQSVQVSDVTWLEEVPEQSLGFAMNSTVNEGSIWAFADPGDLTAAGALIPPPFPKIWVFWASTRSGASNLYWQVISPPVTR